jgi:RAB protein geranylgeranyltransferase component A
LQGTFLYLNNEYHTIPLSKSEIFKNDLLSLIDKRKLVKTIEQCLCLYDNETNPDKNQNSTHVYEMNVNITKSELVQIQSNNLISFCSQVCVCRFER